MAKLINGMQQQQQPLPEMTTPTTSRGRGGGRGSRGGRGGRGGGTAGIPKSQMLTRNHSQSQPLSQSAVETHIEVEAQVHRAQAQQAQQSQQAQQAQQVQSTATENNKKKTYLIKRFH